MRFSHYRTQYLFLERFHSLSLSPKKKRKQYTNDNDINELQLNKLDGDDDELNLDDVVYHEILKFDSMKSIINILQTFILKRNYKSKANFFTKINVFQRVNSIELRKKFFYLKKLLVLRNVIIGIYYNPSLLLRKALINWHTMLYKNKFSVLKFRFKFASMILKVSQLI